MVNPNRLTEEAKAGMLAKGGRLESRGQLKGIFAESVKMVRMEREAKNKFYEKK